MEAIEGGLTAPDRGDAFTQFNPGRRVRKGTSWREIHPHIKVTQEEISRNTRSVLRKGA
ncbi:hypothetical protein Q8W71_04525 [Methylobacterium sp. NEAU 140]|uniref:hypothetical protein n=1 Tax=Methylobacterium sp. NEAU 140 TaxID=3064945 RepID=UPI002733EE62|nr:hypothetical protein [Methylobacterium sp. NEAU 140]MDP4021882.1 hypothetical protein [Methylobacterium sp. NEAU 140]